MNNHSDLLVDQKVVPREFSPGQRSVLEAMDRWIEAVAGGDPEEVAALYAPDAVFWGTVSPFLRTTPEGVLDYFRFPHRTGAERTRGRSAGGLTGGDFFTQNM